LSNNNYNLSALCEALINIVDYYVISFLKGIAERNTTLMEQRRLLSVVVASSMPLTEFLDPFLNLKVSLRPQFLI
jgi:hypothetical protein